MDERRRDPRVPVKLEAEVRFTSWHVFQLIYTLNISRGGMSIEVSELPQEGMAVKVRFLMPSGPPFELEGTVKHAAPSPTRARPGAPAPAVPPRYQVGVQFEGLDDARKAQIEQAIRTYGGGVGPITGIKRREG